ncbi:ribonucleotide reductase Ia, beta subunit [Vibrio phage C-ZP2022]|nr:ribonucleotide reductase Ia, beta subunit [Vibrio phage C-ZP2022]
MVDVFKSGPTDYLNQPMFLGEPVSTARYDEQTHPEFERLISRQLAFFWRPEEINITKDRIDFEGMTDHERFIFTENLKYQTLLDSIQGRSPNLAFLELASIPELETWIETWSFSECLAEGTEVLTTSGWKDMADVTVEDQCLVYDLDDDSVHFEHPKRVPEYDVEGDIVHFKSKNGKQFDQLVTPNHRMPVIHRDRRNDGTQKRYFNEAGRQEYAAHHLAPISGFIKYNEKASSILTPLERFLIALQADGTKSNRYTGEKCGTIPFWFSFQKERKIERLKEICLDGGFELTELTDNKRDDQKRFKVSIPIELLSDVPDPKTFSWVKLGEINLPWAESFLEEVSHWDGHRFHQDAGTTFCYTTTVKENADIVQAVSSLCGRSPRLAVRKDERKETYADVYEINVVARHTKDGQSIEKEIVPYKGKVRCLETSTGAFLIRYNGVVSVTGNTIHSRSYTHIIRNLVNHPEEILSDITVNPAIIKRAEFFTAAYNECIDMNTERRNILNRGETPSEEFMHKHRYHVLKALVTVNALEAIAFYVSFACSFAFAEKKKMRGNGNIIRLIARDEALHLKGTEYMINVLRKAPLWKEAWDENFDEFKGIFLQAVQNEEDWADHLFQHGSLIGLNADYIKRFVRYIANVRMSTVQMGIPFPDQTENPLPWIFTSGWLSSDSTQVAPQEEEITDYLTGDLDTDVSEDDLDSLDFV